MVAYSLEGAQWPDDQITWSLATGTYAADAQAPFSSAIGSSYASAVQWAFQQWASVSPLIFTQVADGADIGQAADIRVGFGFLDTATTMTIGQTNLRWDGAGTLVPDEVVRLEDPSQYPLILSADGSYTYAGTTATLAQTALHEIGHALGLGHAADPLAVMYPSLGAANQTLGATDVAGIQSLYGPPAAALAPSAPAPATLVIQLAEDAWQGDAAFTLSIDGQQVGGVNVVTAQHSAGASQEFAFAPMLGAGLHQVGISFINDAYGGSPEADRNLYLTGARLGDQPIAGATAGLFWNGTASFTVAAHAAAQAEPATTGGGTPYPIAATGYDDAIPGPTDWLGG